MLNCNKAERLKDQFFSEHFITALGKSISNQFKDFNKEDFNQQIYTPAWKYLELKAKRRHVTEALTSVLPDDYPEALEILLKAAPGFTGFNDMVFGFGDTENTEVNELIFDPAELNIGEKGSLSFRIVQRNDRKQRLRMEYAVDYIKLAKKSSRFI